MQGTVGIAQPSISTTSRFRRRRWDEGIGGTHVSFLITSSCMTSLYPSTAGLVTRSERSYICMQVINLFKSVNCGVELQRKKLETCRCFSFSCFMPFHFVFLVSQPRVTSWWRTTKVTMVPQVPIAWLQVSLDCGPRVPPPVRFQYRHVEEVSRRPNSAFCTFDLHEVWSRNTNKYSLTRYRF